MADDSGNKSDQQSAEANSKELGGANNNNAPAQAEPELSLASLRTIIQTSQQQLEELRELGTSVRTLAEEMKKLAANSGTSSQQLQTLNGNIQTVLAEVRTLANNSESDAEKIDINFDMNPEDAARANAVAQEKKQEIQRRRENQCHRCNKMGHWKSECPWNGTDKWFCYRCNGVRGHHPNQCPEKIQRLPE